MSVVARQSFKYSIIGYLGFFIGTCSTFFVFPNDLEFYGKLRYILPTAEMFLPLVVFGLSFSNVKFFHETHALGKHQNILSLSFAGIVINFIIFSIGYFVINECFPSLKTTKLWEMKRLILPLVLVLAVSALLNKYLSNYKRIVIPNVFENLFPKLANLATFGLFFFFGFPEDSSYIIFFTVFLVALLGYVLYTNKLEPIKLDFSLQFIRENHLLKRILNYSFYGFLGNMGSYLALRINNFMIGEYLSFEENGLYSNLYSIVALINIPAMGLYTISAPMINKHLSENTMKDLNQFHKSTSLSLFFVGLVLFSCILVGFPFLGSIMKNGNLFVENEPIAWILGSVMLFDLATGFNGHIISMSKYYRFNIFVMMVLSATTIGLNILFIHYTNLGILGIAIASSVSLMIFNIMKITFNYKMFKVFPLSKSMLYAIALCALVVGVGMLLPRFNNNFINLIYKPIFVLIGIFIGNHYLKIYPVMQYLSKTFLKSLIK